MAMISYEKTWKIIMIHRQAVLFRLSILYIRLFKQWIHSYVSRNMKGIFKTNGLDKLVDAMKRVKKYKNN